MSKETLRVLSRRGSQGVQLVGPSEHERVDISKRVGEREGRADGRRVSDSLFDLVKFALLGFNVVL